MSCLSVEPTCLDRILSKEWKEHVDRLNAKELLEEVKGKFPNNSQRSSFAASSTVAMGNDTKIHEVCSCKCPENNMCARTCAYTCAHISA